MNGSQGTGRKTGIMYGSRIPTIWVNAVTGQGVTGDGAHVQPKIGPRRKNPNLVDLLDTALSYGARRIMLLGKAPEPPAGVRHWLLVQTPGWKPGGHQTSQPIVGIFQHEATGHDIEVRTAEEWFGDLGLTPAQARQAWDVTEAVVKTIDERQHLLKTPSRTGLALWWLSLPRDRKTKELRIPERISDDIAEELHRTSGQHHIEHLVAGAAASSHDDCVPFIDPAKTPRLDTFTYVDGRFMYAALGRELGIGPGRRLNRAGAYELMTEQPFARAWYEIRFTVPEGWHHVGIFGVKHDNPADGWFYPNRPGARHVTWADASEVAVALAYGWLVEPLQAIEFTKGRPLDNYMERLNRKREEIEGNEELPRPLRRAVTAALRAILIQSVGGFAARGSKKTMIVESALDVPPDPLAQRTMRRHGNYFTYEAPGDRHETANYHPELAVQVWARGRARVLSAPTSLGLNTGGALHLPADSLIGLNGDAIYTTAVPRWAVPEQHGGGDDGRTGRLRLKGVARGNYATPETLAQRDALRQRAEKAGPSAAWAEGGQ